jgi:hypothetical protein
MKAARWLQPPVNKKVNPYVDPMGGEYQTPLADPLKVRQEGIKPTERTLIDTE